MQAPGPRGPQEGAALVIGLIMLALLSIMGAAAYSMATLEERMAGNARDQIRAFEAAEASLRDCEAELLGNPTFTASGNGGFYLPKPAGSATDHWQDLDATPPPSGGGWKTSSQVRVLPTAALDLVGTGMAALQPRCIVEQVQTVQMRPPGGSLRAGVAVEELVVYRATARGYGLNASTEATVQSTYRR